jgi:hypothetical protein
MACRRSPAAFLYFVLALAAAALPFPAGAQTYDVELKTTLNDLPVTVESLPFSGRLVMKLTNRGTAKVRCDLRYDASPQPIRRSYVYLEPGETAENSFQAKRKWFSVTVEVTCKPADK